MYFLTGKKVYSANFDAALKVYRAVELYRDDNGVVRFKMLDTGISKKPKNRQVCTTAEVIAQLGPSIGVKAKASEPPKTSEAANAPK